MLNDKGSSKCDGYPRCKLFERNTEMRYYRQNYNILYVHLIEYPSYTTYFTNILQHAKFLHETLNYVIVLYLLFFISKFLVDSLSMRISIVLYGCQQGELAWTMMPNKKACQTSQLSTSACIKCQTEKHVLIHLNLFETFY